MANVSLPDILQLSVPDRLRIATAIWDSIASEQDKLPLTEEQQQEILRRSAAHKSHPEEAIPLEESLARIRRSL
jgi:putative addiction module component (TIGR02574 family)